MNHQDIHSSKYSGDDRPSKNRQGKFPEGFLQKVKETVNLIEIIGEHVVLKKSGSNYTGLCPFHSERTPSFSVNEIKQLYHCYGCKKGGDVITFTMEILGVDFLDAIEELAEKARVALPGGWRGASDDPEREKKRSVQREKEALAFKLNRFAAAFFHQNLFNSASAMEYLMKRGVDQEWMKIFYIGMAPDGWDSLVNHLQTKKAPLELAAELGLIRPSTKSIGSGKGYFDLFRNRILFPILNLRGKVAGFGGRALSDSDTPKYLNSPESLIYQKSKLVFGLYQAQKFIREQDEVILVEGYFDVLAMQMAGFRNVVATCGTALTPDHLSLFKRFARRVTLLFDGDRAGISATERAMEIGLEQGWVLYGAKIPEGKDPDEVLFDLNTGLPHSQGKEKMKAILQDAKALLDEAMSENIQVAQKGPEERVQALKRMGGWLARFQDSVGREVRVQLIQKQLGVSRQLVEEAMGLKGGNLRDKKSGVTFLPQGSPERGGG